VPLRATIKRNAEPKRFPGFLHARDAASWPDRRRGLSNFLTWALFLAEVIAADLFFGNGAKAAGDLDPTPNAKDVAAAATDGVAASEAVGKAAEPNVTPVDPLLNPGSSAMPQVATDAATAPKLSAIDNDPSAGSSPGGGGGGGSESSDGADASSADTEAGLPGVSADAPADLGDVLSNLPPGIAVDLGLDLQPLDLTFGLDASLLPLDLDFELGAPFLDIDVSFGLDLTGTQSAFMQLGDATGLSLFEGFGSAAEFSEVAPLIDSASAFSPSLLVEIGPTSLVAPGGQISSDGSLVFAASQSIDIASDGLFAGPSYTDYNLALQSQAAQSATSVAQNLDDPDALLAGLPDLGHVEASLSQLSDPALSSDQDLLRGHAI
jgi:hypothetical protein